MAAETKVLLVGFGGPEDPSEIRPFIASVLGGRPVPPSRIEEVVAHYMEVGGRSPYNDDARRLAAALRSALRSSDPPLEVVLGLRHSRPGLSEVLREEARAGTRTLVAVPMTPHEGADAGGRYAAALDRAATGIGPSAPRIVWTRPYYDAEGFVEAWSERIAAAAPAGAAGSPPAPLVFTAHSVPVGAAEPYRSQVRASAARIASALGLPEGAWSLAWQSRSGPPQEPWLEPDVCDELDRLIAAGAREAVVAPIGFVCDHVEVLYDLGVEARDHAKAAGLSLTLVPTVGAHPRFVGALAALARAALAPESGRPAAS